MEEQKESIQPVEEDTLDQVNGGVDTIADELVIRDQKPTNFPPIADIRFI